MKVLRRPRCENYCLKGTPSHNAREFRAAKNQFQCDEGVTRAEGAENA